MKYTNDEFTKLLASSERNRKKKKCFPDFWLKRNYLPERATELAFKFFTNTITPEELSMTLVAQCTKIEFWIIRGYSEKDSIQMVSNIQTQNSYKYVNKYSKEERKEKNHTCIEYYLSKNYSLEEATSILSERQSTFSLEKCISRYGIEEGTTVFNNRQVLWQNTLKAKPQEEIDLINASKAVSLEGLCNKYGVEQGTVKYNAWCDAHRFTFEYCKQVYGEEIGLEKYNALKLKLSVSLDGFIQKYGKEQGTIRHNEYKNKAGHSLDKYIARYGDIEGTLKYEDYIVSRSRFYSDESLKYFRTFIPQDILSMSKYGENELLLWDKSESIHRIFFYDFTFKDVIVEYHGHMFHANPKLPIEKLMEWKNPFNKNITYTESIALDERKRKNAINHGYKYFEIYSNDSEDYNSIIKQQILDAF